MAPDSRLQPHRGVFAGTLRLHLALIVPTDAADETGAAALGTVGAASLRRENLRDTDDRRGSVAWYDAHHAPQLPRVRFALCERAPDDGGRAASGRRPTDIGDDLYAGCDSAARWTHDGVAARDAFHHDGVGRHGVLAQHEDRDGGTSRSSRAGDARGLDL